MSSSTDAPHFQNDFALDDFRRRRDAVADAIGDGVAILQGLPDPAASVTFRQHNDFYYLCGVEVPHAYLVIDGRTRTTTLLLLPRDDKLAESDGPELNATEADLAQGITGVDRVLPSAELVAAIPRGRTAYVSCAPPEGRQAYQDTLRMALKRAQLDPTRNAAVSPDAFSTWLQAERPDLEITDLSHILSKLRGRKCAKELALMRRAGQLTAQAIVAAMRATKPGLYEYQLAAICEYEFLNSGARGGGYRPIIAAGRNIWNMHYFRMDCRLAADDLVLADYAPDVNYYTSDIGRIWPASGKYAPHQREIYGFIVDYQLVLLDLLGPGKTIQEISQTAAQKLQPLVTRTTWSRSSVRTAIDAMLGSCVAFTHPVGMSVHDVGQYKDQPLEPGVVFALDPQLWIRDERLYLRVEDTVAITEDGVENLTAAAPHQLEAVESIVGSS